MAPDGSDWRDRSTPSTPPGRGQPVLSRGPFRGRFYPRGRSGPPGPRGHGHPSVPRIPGKNILEGLYPSTIQVIEKPAEVPAGDDIVIGDVQYITSYSWAEGDEPTILVPGSPRLWKNDLPFPFRAPRDSGIVFVYQNGHRCPSYPLLPLFVAADTMESDGHSPTTWSSVDIVTDRNNLRKLWSFVENPEPSDFRIDLELVGPWTVLMQRWEERTAEEVEMRGFGGYGDSFEQTCTTTAPGCERGIFAGHHRVISYDMSGLKLVVRCEVDACFAPEEASAEVGDQSQNNASSPDDDLTNALKSLSISSSSNTPASATTLQKQGLTVVKAGSIIPQSSLIKVKSRSEQSMTSLRWYEIYPQLLLGQTFHSMIGVHRSGEFSKVRHVELDSPELEDVARSAQSGLRKLRWLLEEIQHAAMERGQDAKLSLVCRQGMLVLMKRTSSASLLPVDVLKRFEV